MSENTLEEMSLDEFLTYFSSIGGIVIPVGSSQIGLAIKNAHYAGWNACLERMKPEIERRAKHEERERLAKLAEQDGTQITAAFGLSSAEIRAGKIEKWRKD